MPEPSVGVVIPAFDAAAFIGEAIASVIATGHEALDVVVVDNGSSDATSAVAGRYGPPVRVIRLPVNRGPGGARNVGAAAVHGDVLAFLDADDRWTERSLAVRLAALEPGVEAVFGHVRTFGPDREPGPRQAAVLPGGMLIRRDALARVGPFSEDTLLSEGLEWMLRAGEAGLRTVVVEEQVLWRRVHGANLSVRHRADRGEYARALKASLDRRRATEQR